MADDLMPSEISALIRKHFRLVTLTVTSDATPQMISWSAVGDPYTWPAPERDTHAEWRELNEANPPKV